MSLTTSLRFGIAADENQVFQFVLRRAARIRIIVATSEPVNVLLLDREEVRDYESENDEESDFTAKWGRKVDLDVAQRPWAGQWSIVI